MLGLLVLWSWPLSKLADGPVCHQALAASALGAEGSNSPSAQKEVLPDDYDLARAELVARTLAYIEELYVKIEEIVPSDFFEAGLRGLAEVADDALWVPPESDKPGALMVGRRVLLLDPAKMNELADLPPAFSEVFAFYLDARELDAEDIDIEYGTIRGMLRELDRPTRLLVRDRLDNFRIRSRGSLSGVGCRIRMVQEVPTVVYVIEGSPAEAEGLLEDDRIVKVDGESTINMRLSEVVSRIRGPVGTTVTLDLKRGESSKALEMKIKRARIKIDNVSSQRLPSNIGYIRITNFSDQTVSNFNGHLRQITSDEQPIEGLVLDLRRNGGGSLRQSAFMVDKFVGEGTIVTTEGRSARAVKQLVRRIPARPQQVLEGVPIVVLVDGRTASGAEILAGALKYMDRAILVGQPTFGKGSVQKVYTVNQRASLKLTVARYLIAAEHAILPAGLQPDITLIPLIADEDRLYFRYPKREQDSDESESDVDDPQAPDSTEEAGDGSSNAPTLYYLDQRIRDEGDQSPEEKLLSDFQIRFAADLLQQLKNSDRHAMLHDEGPFVRTVVAEQEIAVNEALEARGIDWSTEGDAEGAAAEVKLETEPGGLLPAGEETQMILTVKNTGKAPFLRLRAVCRSAARMFNGREFLFGRIDPGESRSWPVKLSIPTGASPGRRLLTFEFTGEGSVPEPFIADVAIEARRKPALELDVTYEDLPQEGQGKSNRQVEVGELVVVKAWVRNVGPEPTEQITLSLRNPLKKGIELREARTVLEPIEPGGQAEARLTFALNAVDEGADASRFTLTLRVVERTHGIRLYRELRFGQPWSGLLQIKPPKLTISDDLVNTVVEGEHFSLSGQVTASQGLRHISFYRNGQKVQRLLPGIRAEHPVTATRFETDIPLVEGSNRIDVLCEDEVGLVSRQRFWLRAIGKAQIDK